jgi:hypothetical protein
MKPALALHRSLTFWAGTMIAIFLCWACWDSSHKDTILQWQRFIICSSDRGLKISRSPQYPFLLYLNRVERRYPPGWQHETFAAPFLVRPPDTFHVLDAPPPTTVRERERQFIHYNVPATWVLYLPYWLILLAFIISWSLLLLWRARRLKRVRA